MARVRIRCLSCGDKFYAPSLTEIPPDCPSCGVLIVQKEMPEVAMPFIPLKGGAHSKAIDNVYRDAEKAAEDRISHAVEMTPGSTRADFAQLKVTDYRTNMVEGESAVPIPPTSTEFNNHIAAMKGAGQQVTPNGGMVLTGQAQAYSSMTQAGPNPNAGAKAMKRLKEVHAQRLDPRINNAVSNIPALETQAPGYVARA